MTEYRLCGVHGCDNDKQVDLITAGDWTCITISVLVEVPVIQPLQLPAAQNNMSFDNSALEQKLAQVYHLQYPLGIIRHINPLLFDVIDDKPEGVARGVYHVIMYKHEPVGRGFIHYHINREQVYV